MPDLEMLLREIRPVPEPAWAARLDARAAARFPGPPPRWKAPLIALRDHLLALGVATTVAVGLLALVITGLNGRGSDDAGSGGGASTTLKAPEADSAGDSGDKSAREGAQTVVPAQGGGGAALSRDRAVISSASLTLSTSPDRVNAVTDRAIRVVDGLGGFVQTSEVNSSGSSASATLTVKIPSAKLETGLAQLSRLAHVRARTQQSQDVTDQREALEAAVRDARADRAGLRARLAKATTDAERSKLRAQLDRATRRVTQRERRVAQLGQEVSYATVDVAVEGDRRSGAVPPGGRWTPGDAVGDAVRVLEVIAGVLVIAVAVLLPVALIAAAAAFTGRAVTRRRRERALNAA